MKKVNVVTYCTYKSLGSILQAYGLQKQLDALNCDSKILMYKTENELISDRVHSLKSLCRKAFKKLIQKQVNLAYKKRVGFIAKNIKIHYFDKYSEFSDYAKSNETDIYLSGSDQVWQPDNCNPVFFLDFAENRKRISYAASMGKTMVTSEKEEAFKKYINNFDVISVREDECAEVIRNLTNKKIEVHIDPTFLVTAEEWRRISVPYKPVKEPYILLYMLYWNDSLKNKVKKIKEKTGLKVIAIADGLSKVYADKICYDVGVDEFLWLVDHAEYVVTSSFHGTAFATIFNKKFATIINPNAPSRIVNLLSKLSLPHINIEDLVDCNEFDYQKTNDLINYEKERSIEYLKKGLE